MPFFDEPTDKPGASQILNDTQTTEVGQNTGQVWLKTRDNTSPRRLSVWTAGADAIVWLTSAGLVARGVLFIQRLIELGIVANTPAVLALVAFALFSIFLCYKRFTKDPTSVTYRISLFTMGLILALL